MKSIKEIKKKPLSDKVMGIDPSTQKIAFATMSDAGLGLCGAIDLKGKDLYDKLATASNYVAATLPLINPDFVVVESSVYVNNRQTIIKLAMLFGTIVAEVRKKGVGIAEVTPLLWQSHLGNPRSTPQDKKLLKKQYPKAKDSWIKNELRKQRKQKTIQLVEKEFNYKTEDNDIADAIGIAKYGWDELTERK